MPVYKTLYLGQFVNIETDISNANNQKQIDIYIYDRDSGVGAVENTIDLEMTDEPIFFETVNNAEDKFTVLRPKRAEMKIFSSDSIKIETFSGGGDKRFYVEIKYDSQIKFIGFLSTSDLSQDFLPDPNTITLIATDSLNYLSNIPLTDFDSANPTYEHRIIDYLAWALSKTDLQLNIVACLNIRDELSPPITNVPLVTATTFSFLGVSFNVAETTFFYVGQSVTITGTANNNQTFTVTSVSTAGGLTTVRGGSFLAETGVSATFTDNTIYNGHLFIWNWLYAKTFEDDINTCVNCAQVIDIILRKIGFIQQKNGYWFISRIDEIENTDQYLFTFDYLGNYVSDTTSDLSKSIGVDNLLSWMNDDCQKSLESAVKSIELDFPFDIPKELLTNYDLSRGTDLTSTTIDPESIKLEKWVGASPPFSASQTSTAGYILKVLNTDGLEIERYLHIETSASPEDLHFRFVDKIYVHAGDKFSFSVDWKYDTNPGGSGHYRIQVAQFRLYGNDGTYWTVNGVGGYGSSDPRSYWLQSVAGFTTNNRFLYQEGDFATDDLSDWINSSFDAARIPVDGQLQVYLIHNSNTNSRNRSFSAISFDYHPYIAGTYQKYIGQQYKTSQLLDTVLLIKDDVGISGTVKYNFKRALLKLTDVRVLFTGTVIITDTNKLTLPLASGFKNDIFTVGKKITTTGTNKGFYTIESISYSIIGDQTVIVIKEDNLTNVTESMTINELLFSLTDSFYDAARLPSGISSSDDLHPFGHIQLFDNWNQSNRVMAKFEGNVDHLSATNDILDISNKLLLTDNDLSTNGKTFIALHIRSDLHLVESKIFLHEVFDENIAKEYPDRTFKYVT